jgi:fatty acid amide hydrolase 2
MTGLTERSATELARAIRAREHSAAEVVNAHIDCHRRWSPLINALVVDRFANARLDAERADERIAAAGPGEQLPPLLGVPFTVKEAIALRGMPNSSGLAARRDVRADETAPVVQRLIDAGAIPLGMTNTSELTLWIESANRLYGRTSNPYDQRRTAGGSSGGEGAAVGCGGSPFGVGSDIAGSIRIPALFSGVFGHKPSTGLVPNAGMYPPASGDADRLLGTGPLARRAEDLMPLLRIMSGARLGDPASVSLNGLRVTTVENSSLLPISRELRDARERAVGALVSAGAVVQRIELRSWRRALLPYLVTLQAGAGQTTAALLEAAGAVPPGWRSLLRRGGDHTLPTRMTVVAERLPRFEGPALERMLRAARELAAELIDAIGEGVLLHPAFATVAPPHGRTVGRPWLFKSAAMFNLAGVPVTEVPLGLSTGGLPLGVQVAAGVGSDHLSIAVALELERVFMGWVLPRLIETVRLSVLASAPHRLNIACCKL